MRSEPYDEHESIDSFTIFQLSGNIWFHCVPRCDFQAQPRSAAYSSWLIMRVISLQINVCPLMELSPVDMIELDLGDSCTSLKSR